MPETFPTLGDRIAGWQLGNLSLRLCGIPVQIAVGFLLGVALVIPFFGLAWALAVFCAPLIHELGCAFLAKRWNLKPSVILHPWGGITSHARVRKLWQEILLPLVGILTSSAFGALCLFALSISAGAPENVREILSALAKASLFWALFQCLPAMPLSGGRVLFHVLKRWFPEPRAARLTLKVGIGSTAAALGAVFWLGLLWISLLVACYLLLNVRRLQLSPTTKGSDRYARRLFADAQRSFSEGDFREAFRLCHLIRDEPFLIPRMLRQVWLLLAKSELAMGRYKSCLDDLKYAGEGPEVDDVREECERRLASAVTDE